MYSLQSLEEHCPIGLSQHLRSGDFVTASAACARLFGIAQPALVGRNLFSLIGAAAQTLRDAFIAALSTESERRIRFRYVRPDGAASWLQATIGPVKETPESDACDAESAPRIVLCVQDVTTEAEAEQALRERLAQAELAERHRDYLVKMTPGLIWFGPVSPDLSSYRAVYMSEYLFRVMGYTAEQWLQTPGFWRSVIHPDDAERILAGVASAMANGTVLGPYRIRKSDGRYMWIRSQMLLERDDSGVPLRMYGLTLDVTSFVQAEADRVAALEHVEILKRRLDALVSTLPGIVWERWLGASPEQENYCSAYVEHLTGYSKTEWTDGREGFLRFVPENSRAEISAAVAGIMESGEGSLQHKLVTKDGREIWLENHIIAVRDAAGVVQCLRGVALDMTERKRAEEERLALQRAIAEQARQLLELSTPLIPISDDVLVLPLIGTLDPARAQHSLDTLLNGVTLMRIRKVLVDLTGVGVVDSIGAAALMRMIGAARLLGARVILTGMRPEIARTLTDLDVDLDAISTRRSLHAAVLEFVVNKKKQAS